MNESTTPRTKQFTACASLAALGVKLKELKLFEPIEQRVHIAQKSSPQGLVTLLGHPAESVAEEVALDWCEPADRLPFFVLRGLLERIETE